ncbi:HAD hydrolase-like protein [Caldilinea sp.]|uniref:HAD hydrolase-like protein n=1 Tax=Caldilinea sp. TaxID=2293560 RepID=UPI002CF93674|nr:HAD hydrolase-like protein [Caldilinea sp.]
MKYKLAIFDFDGTLADSFPWAASVVNQYAERYGFKRIEPADHAALRNYDARKLMQHLGVRMWKVPGMARDVRKRMAQEIDQIPLFPGVSEMLQALVDQGLQLAAVSSNSEANVRAVLGPQNTAHFTLFNCGASVFGKAPKLKSVMKKCRVSPETVILIGDEIRDAHAAHKVGIDFGAVTWGYTNPEALLALHPHEIFESVEEIATKLVGNQPRQSDGR